MNYFIGKFFVESPLLLYFFHTFQAALYHLRDRSWSVFSTCRCSSHVKVAVVIFNSNFLCLVGERIEFRPLLFNRRHMHKSLLLQVTNHIFGTFFFSYNFLVAVDFFFVVSSRYITWTHTHSRLGSLVPKLLYNIQQVPVRTAIAIRIVSFLPDATPNSLSKAGGGSRKS